MAMQPGLEKKRSRQDAVQKVEAKMEKLANAVLKTRQKMARLLELVAREKENKKKGRPSRLHGRAVSEANDQAKNII